MQNLGLEANEISLTYLDLKSLENDAVEDKKRTSYTIKKSLLSINQGLRECLKKSEVLNYY